MPSRGRSAGGLATTAGFVSPFRQASPARHPVVRSQPAEHAIASAMRASITVFRFFAERTGIRCYRVVILAALCEVLMILFACTGALPSQGPNTRSYCPQQRATIGHLRWVARGREVESFEIWNQSPGRRCANAEEFPAAVIRLVAIEGLPSAPRERNPSRPCVIPLFVSTRV